MLHTKNSYSLEIIKNDNGDKQPLGIHEGRFTNENTGSIHKSSAYGNKDMLQMSIITHVHIITYFVLHVSITLSCTCS
jgi:hypothetical protein